MLYDGTSRLYWWLHLTVLIRLDESILHLLDSKALLRDGAHLNESLRLGAHLAGRISDYLSLLVVGIDRLGASHRDRSELLRSCVSSGLLRLGILFKCRYIRRTEQVRQLLSSSHDLIFEFGVVWLQTRLHFGALCSYRHPSSTEIGLSRSDLLSGLHNVLRAYLVGIWPLAYLLPSHEGVRSLLLSFPLTASLQLYVLLLGVLATQLLPFVLNEELGASRGNVGVLREAGAFSHLLCLHHLSCGWEGLGRHTVIVELDELPQLGRHVLLLVHFVEVCQVPQALSLRASSRALLGCELARYRLLYGYNTLVVAITRISGYQKSRILNVFGAILHEVVMVVDVLDALLESLSLLQLIGLVVQVADVGGPSSHVGTLLSAVRLV